MFNSYVKLPEGKLTNNQKRRKLKRSQAAATYPFSGKPLHNYGKNDHAFHREIHYFSGHVQVRKLWFIDIQTICETYTNHILPF